MARWEPNARERLVRAAVELFAEQGYEATTVNEIAERAGGLTKTTFFRHFTDKREVLFAGTHELQDQVDQAIAAAPDGVSPLDAAVAGMAATAAIFNERREYSVRRAAIIAANPSLQERELLKLAAMTDATAAALRQRGTSEPTATLAAHSAVTVFHVAFAEWIAARGNPDFADYIASAADTLRSLT